MAHCISVTGVPSVLQMAHCIRVAGVPSVLQIPGHDADKLELQGGLSLVGVTAI